LSFETRIIEPDPFDLDGEKVTDKALRFSKGAQFVLQVGKRKFARVIMK